MLGNNRIKHLRGWCNKKAHVWCISESFGTSLKMIQIVNRKKTGYSWLPTRINAPVTIKMGW